MSRLANSFQKEKKILNIYCTAGYPKLDSTLPVMKALQEGGADIIELGMPYSDPLADGETIQQSSSVALANGMTIAVLFEQLKVMRSSPEEGGAGISIPVVLMGYMNPILQYGFERFCADAARVGIDGLILPDLPAHEFEHIYGPVLKENGLDFIFLVTPETSEERVRQLDALSSGFLYAVSSSSTTGGKKDFDAVALYLKRLQSYQLKNPVLVGFGISDHESFTAACAHADGAIIGSAYIKMIQHIQTPEAVTKSFVQSILN
ncbi:tryptophan synthase subunit alpha [Niabella terrae]